MLPSFFKFDQGVYITVTLSFLLPGNFFQSHHIDIKQNV